MVLGFIPTGQWKFLKAPQYIEETTFNTPPAAPTFKFVGQMISITPNATTTKENVRVVGNRDLVSQPKMTEVYSLSIKYRPYNTAKMDFAKYGVNLANDATPTGTNAASVAIAWSMTVNNVEKYFIATGCKTDSISIEVTKDGGVNVSQELKCKQIRQHLTDLTSAGITTPTFLTTYPTEDPWSSIDGGTAPCTIEGTEFKVDRFKLDVNQNLAEVAPNGTTSLEYLNPTEREVSVEFDTWLKDSVILDYLMAGTRVDIAYILKSALTPPVRIDVTDAVFSGRDLTLEGGQREFVREGMSGDGMSVALSG
jgi:hypothetical protein